MEDKCKWEKTIKGYITLCGHTPKQMGRGWSYCPLCGKIAMISKVNYQRRYAKAHKEERQEYYKKYYQEHK